MKEIHNQSKLSRQLHIAAGTTRQFHRYRISGIFRVGLIFAEFATSLKSPKIHTAKNKPYHTSSLRALEIVKIGLIENLTHLPSGNFVKISRREKFSIYGNVSLCLGDLAILPISYSDQSDKPVSTSLTYY